MLDILLTGLRTVPVPLCGAERFLDSGLKTARCLSLQNLMAKALYDNVPESPEELAFRKGDILTVIEQNTGGLEGWWLCSLHGRQGIAPGNRLKLLIGPAFEAQPSPAAPSPQSYQQNQQDVYQIPPRTAVAAENTPSKVSGVYSTDETMIS